MEQKPLTCWAVFDEGSKYDFFVSGKVDLTPSYDIKLRYLFMITVCISTKANNAEMLFKGPWALYPNSVDKMDLYFETDTGVDNDYNHRRIHFDYDSCNEPNWGYEYWLYLRVQQKFNEIYSPDSFEVIAENGIHADYVFRIIVFNAPQRRKFSFNGLWR